MNSFSKCSYKAAQWLTAVLMMAGLLFPPMSAVYAQDVEPPAPAETGGDTAPADQAAEPPAEAPVDEAPAAELPPEQTVEAPAEPPAPVEEILPVEQTVEAPSELVTEPTEEAEQPAAVVEAPVEEAAPTETIAEIVQVLAETETVLVDENNEEIPLSSADAVEALENADPFFLSSTGYVGYTSLGGSCPGFVSECNHVSNPVSAALSDDRLTGSGTLYIEGSSSGKQYNESVTINKSINLQAGRNFTRYQGNIHYDSATAIINQITLAANLGYINNVFANTVMVDGFAASTDEVRGDMLDDALALVAQNGRIDLSAGTYKDDANGFNISRDGVTLEGEGDLTVIDGQWSNSGDGIEIDGDYVTVKKIKIVGSYDGIEVDSGDHITLENITLTNNNTGLYVKSGADDINIHHSNIAGNFTWGLFTESTWEVDAENNYWGHANGPTLCGGSSNNPICGTRYGDAIWYYRDINYQPFLTSMICPDGMEEVNGVCMPPEAECDPGMNDVDRDGVCQVSDCAPGEHDMNSDNVCEESSCPNGFTDWNHDGNCEYSDCANGWTDVDNNGICEPSGCEPGMTDTNHDNVCEESDCPVGEHDINSDNVCEPSTCANGYTDVNHDGECESSNCANGWTDTNHDNVCESSGCANGWTDTNQDGTCESSNCANGWTDTDHDNVCESSGCTAGKTDYDHDAVCELSNCQPGEHDVNSDGVCEPTTCSNGFTDVNFDGVCESSGCNPGMTDYDHNNTCELSHCQPGEHDVNSDGVCEPSTCQNGFTDTNFDGVCESSCCTNGNTDFDNNGTCESSGCLAGTNDMDTNGVCLKTACQPNSFDANADGACERTACRPGFNDRNSDGLCQATICEKGTNDDNSDGYCEDDILGEDLSLLGLFGPFAVAGGGEIIPVTGEMNELSCSTPNTLVLPSGNSVEFSAPLCGFSADLDEDSAGSLPAALPEGLTFASGLTLSLEKESAPTTLLPEEVIGKVIFSIPAELGEKTFKILTWDAAANGGLGNWVEVPIESTGVAKIAQAGTFILAY